MTDPGKFSLIKPTLDTPFNIDFDWWKSHDHNWRVFLFSFLCEEHQKAFADQNDDIWIDWIDPQTAEVHHVDRLQHILITHCAKQPDFISQTTTLVHAVFRVLLANGNKPTTPNELSRLIGKPPEIILRTLSGPTVYQGIRPVQQR
jgi:hypothetical protein